MKALRLILAAALSIAMAPVHATQLAKFGDWKVIYEKDPLGNYIEAFTKNEMNESSSVICFESQPDCRWGFSLSMPCEENSTITTIVSNGKDSTQMPFYCMGSEDKKAAVAVLKIEEFEHLIFAGKSYFSLDFGTNGGIHRFSLNGANKAVADARKRAGGK